MTDETIAQVDAAVVMAAGLPISAPAAWLGEAPHFVMMGAVEGRDVDVAVTGAAALAGLAAKREYRTLGDRLAYADFEVSLEAEVGGIPRRFELEFENADFAAHPLPASFSIQGNAFPEGLQTTLEVEMAWDGVDVEVDGWSGTLHLIHDDGTRDAHGVAADGRVAGYASAARGQDWLVVSFTAPVTETDID